MIWPFGRRARRLPRIEVPEGGFADVHSHLLWGIDDGPTEIEGSLALLEAYRDLGYTTIAATPHHEHPSFPGPDRELVARRCKELADRFGEGAPTVVPAGEIMYGDGLLERLEVGALPALGPSSTFLVELAVRPGGVPMGLDEALFRLRLRDVAVVIAHCERYPDLAAGNDLVGRLRRAGAIVQVNLLSIAGRHGRTLRDSAWRLLERGEVDLLATDLHSAMDAPLVSEALSELDAWNRDELVRLASVNPLAVLAGNPWSVSPDA